MTIQTPGNPTNAKQWELYRIELVFFNSRDNRWQLFQETTSPPDNVRSPQGFYRRQIYSMLKDMRQVFKLQFADKRDATGNVIQTPFQSASITNQRPVEINLGPLLDGLDHANATNEARKVIVDNVRDSWKAEGLGNTSNVDYLLHSIEHGRRKRCELTYTEALDLMTCLPFLRHWDIYGSIDPFHKDFAARHPNFVLTPFFTYKILVRPPATPMANCETLLNYNVDLEFPGSTPIQPFYTFCRDVADLASPEAQWYACYGHLVDQIQFALAAPAQDRKVMVAAYQLRVCGWDHYLQLYFRRIDGMDATAGELAKALTMLGGVFTRTTILKECLREFLVQIRIAAFQGYVSDEIGRQSLPDSTEEIPGWVGEFFCKHAHNLVQVDWMRCADKWFGYPPAGGDQTPMWGVLPEPPPEHDVQDYRKVLVWSEPNIEAWTPWEKRYSLDFENVLDPVFAGTSRQRLQEQFEWLTARIETMVQMIKVLKRI